MLKAKVISAESRFAVFADIDGTLANCRHRRHYVVRPTRPVSEPHDLKWKADWKAFFAAMDKDTPNMPVVNTYNALRMLPGMAGVVVTARGEEYREVTEAWLEQRFISYDAIYFRPEKDNRPDVEIKREILAKARADGFEPHVVLDDRDSVVAMWREEGITVFQVAAGNF